MAHSIYIIRAMKRKYGFGVLFLLFSMLPLGVIQSVCAAEWQNVYIEGYATTVVQTVDGGFALAGNTNGNFTLIKVDSLGNLEWSKIYDIRGSLGATDLVQTQDGGYAMAGGGGDFLLVKTDAYGNLVWTQSYGNEEKQVARAVIQTEDGGYALVGLSIGPAADPGYKKLDYWLVKTDSAGNMLWNQTYGSSWSMYYAYDLVQTQDGGYTIIGGGLGLVKTDSSGTIEWNNTIYSIGSSQGPRALIQTSDGGYAMVGGDFVLSKANATGDMEWLKTFSGSLARSLVEVADGYVLCGEYRINDDSGAQTQKFRLVKTNLNGNEIWTRDFVGLGFCVIQTLDGGLAAAGEYSINPWPEGTGKFYLIKTDAAGLTTPLEPDPSPTIPASNPNPSSTTNTGSTGGTFSTPWYFKWTLLLTLTVIGALILTAYVVANRKSKSTMKGLNGK